MEDDSQLSGTAKAVLGAIGLSAFVPALAFRNKVGIIITVLILVLFLLCFGGYYLWRRLRAKRQSQQFTAALEAQTSAAPKAISDPNKRAALDKLRQKFQTGMAQFKTRDKDIYKLPWYAIIGEPGSGKSEAIRHSGIDFPPGMQDELQGSGGTVNMDWWFTNRGIILDTAGSMIFNEAGSGDSPEWKEFLRLLKKTRPHCPLNGLFLVLSVESLIRDSADTIARKSSRLAQQLDLIQRALDVRFPVYLLVTKCDLLIGFREFFDSNDPDFQYQMFGWSNPDPLDSHFRPDLVEQHLSSVAARLRRRRLALLRDTSGAGRLGDTQQFFSSSYQLGKGAAQSRRLDEVDSLFALPESVMRLAPRLRRYLETVFVAGEWSAKPVFLRGIYFTSSMREGKALDEAISLATGLSLDQLPDDKSWEKNRAFFLRDLFLEKVFRESGLVTRATNTLKMLRKRQLLIFGSAGAALLLLLGFATYGYFGLKQSVLNEAGYWEAGAANLKPDEWSPGVIHSGEGGDPNRYTYTETKVVDAPGNPTVVEFHSRLKSKIEGGFSVPFIFKPFGKSEAKNRAEAQRKLYELGVLRPIISATRRKMQGGKPPTDDPGSLGRHRDALLSLVQIETELANRKPGEGLSGGTNGMAAAEKYLNSFVSYLTDTDRKVSTNLADVFAWTYLGNPSGKEKWAPEYFSGGDRLSNNPAIKAGLQAFRDANQTNEIRIKQELDSVNTLVRALGSYRDAEQAWLQNPANSCAALATDVAPLKSAVDKAWSELRAQTNFAPGLITNLNARYVALETAAQGAANSSMSDITAGLGETAKGTGIIGEVRAALASFGRESADAVRTNRVAQPTVVADLDANFVSPFGGKPAFESRWMLYSKACELRNAQVSVTRDLIGDAWTQYRQLQGNVDQFSQGLTNYTGPFAPQVAIVCDAVAGTAVKELKERFLADYVRVVTKELAELANPTSWTLRDVTNSRSLFERVQLDLKNGKQIGIEESHLAVVRKQLEETRRGVLSATAKYVKGRIGFPVKFDASATAMSLDGLKELSALLAGLSKELEHPIWQADASEALKSLQADSDRYAKIVASLVNADGSPVEWELSFVPPEENSGDHTIVKVYPYAQVTLGTAKSIWKPVAADRNPIPFGKTPINSSLEITFRKFVDVAASEVVALKHSSDWGLLREIVTGNATRLKDGLNWRFKVKLEDKSQNLSGHAEFEAQVKTKLGLPEVKEWPK